MANRSKNQAPARSSRKAKPASSPALILGDSAAAAPGRLAVGAPVAIIDIGSNSVRLVIYEGLTRAPTALFNEKVLCGLGKGIATTGMLNPEGVTRALLALRRFRVLCETAGVSDVHVLATAAARDARNGPAFLEEARAALGVPVELLSSQREAELAALGVISAFSAPDGVVGDLGGGSLELTDLVRTREGARIGAWTSLPLGGLALIDRSGRSPKKAAAIVRDSLKGAKVLERLKGRTFYAVGGTWRSLARLHMMQRNYPLHVMHGYSISARDALDFARLVETVDTEALVSIGSVSSARRPLLAYGAAVMEQVIRLAKPADFVISAQGVREGLLYERLDAQERLLDPLLATAQELNLLRARSPAHAHELIDWADAFFKSSGIEETKDEKRLRHAACLLSDISWRAHPDYRGEQSLNTIAHAAFIGVDHPGRAYLALASSYRHLGVDADVSPHFRMLVSARVLDHARLLGAAMRVAFICSVATPGVLPLAPLRCERGELVLSLPPSLAALASDRLAGRLKQLAKLIGRPSRIKLLD